MALMRARHPVFGVKDVNDSKFNRDNGWDPVDPATPTSEQERSRAVNEVRRGTYDPAKHTAGEVVEQLEQLPPPEQQQIVAAEKSGRSRKTVLEQPAQD